MPILELKKLSFRTATRLVKAYGTDKWENQVSFLLQIQ